MLLEVGLALVDGADEHDADGEPHRPSFANLSPVLNRAGFVYFIGYDAMVKIGWSRDPTSRLADLQVGAPVKLSLLGFQKGTRIDEKFLHRLFRDHRSHGEWFRRCPEIDAVIAAALAPEKLPNLEVRNLVKRRRRITKKARNRRYFLKHRERLTLRRQEVREARRALATVRDYDTFVRALITQRHTLGWSQLELDERAGFQTGYTSKLEAWRGPQGRVAGSVTMPLWLQALGIGFVPVPLLDGRIHDQAKALKAITRPLKTLVEMTRRIPPDDAK